MNNQIKHPKGDRILLLTNNILLSIIVLVIVGPLLYVFLSSFLEPNAIIRKGLSLHASDWSLEGYKRLFTDDTIVRGFFNSLLYSTGFTIVTVVVCLFAGYPLSVNGFVGKNFFMTLLYYNDVLWRRAYPDLPCSSRSRNVKYALGDYNTGSSECMEYYSR